MHIIIPRRVNWWWFRSDLRACKNWRRINLKLICNRGISRNQYHEVIRIAYEEGFDFIRSNPRDWFWGWTEDNGLLKRFLEQAIHLFI